ncbi:MAG TPA: ComF family protein [Allosphingosinicella sp.]|nr:ComF family protein [Allosphingosinicella sp.]
MPAPAAAFASAALRSMLDFALPPRCPACGAITREPHRFCLGCWRSLTFLGEPCCVRCGLPFEYAGGGEASCGRCLAEPPPFDRLRAAVAYDEVSRQVALKLKYSGRPGLAETLAHFMLRQLSSGGQLSAGGQLSSGGQSSPGEGEALLVPVPLHRWRIWKRGYNQAALIASALSRRTGLPVGLDLLSRTRATPPLQGLGRRERALAVRGAFKVPPRARPRLAGRRILLVDDVYTSGATAAACALALKRGGAASVDILCWARVVHVDSP